MSVTSIASSLSNGPSDVTNRRTLRPVTSYESLSCSPLMLRVAGIWNSATISNGGFSAHYSPTD